MSELTKLIKEAAKRKKRKELSALKKHYRTAINWIKKHPGRSAGLGALGVGAGYGGYEAIKHLLNREKKSSLFDENIVDKIANEIVKEAKATKTIAKAVKKLKKRKAAPTLAKTYRNTINWIKKNPGKTTGLGALGVGAGYGGYEGIKHLLNREKKSSLLDEIIADELVNEIVKQAAEDEIYDELLADADADEYEDYFDEDEDEDIDEDEDADEDLDEDLDEEELD